MQQLNHELYQNLTLDMYTCSILFTWFTIWFQNTWGIPQTKKPEMLNNKPSFKHRQSKWYWERILTVTNDFSGICRRNLKRSKNQTMSLQSLQGLSQSTMQLCQIFHTWRYVLQVDGILWSICCNMSSTAFHTIHSRNAATNKLQVPSQRKHWRWYLYKHLPIEQMLLT